MYKALNVAIQCWCVHCVCLPAIGRTLIPRYFSTVFEGGVTDLYYILKHSKESFHNSCITVDCDQCTMVTQHGKPMFTKVKMLSFQLYITVLIRSSFVQNVHWKGKKKKQYRGWGETEGSVWAAHFQTSKWTYATSQHAKATLRF